MLFMMPNGILLLRIIFAIFSGIVGTVYLDLLSANLARVGIPQIGIFF